MKRGAAVLGVLLSVAPASYAKPAKTNPTGCTAYMNEPLTHVRVLDPTVRAALFDGLRRSQTLVEIVARVEAMDGIVYLLGGSFRPTNRNGLRGAMSHEITVATSTRILKVIIEPRANDSTIGTIGHELWHALEVLQVPDAIDTASVERLYTRIGFKASAGVYETDGAADAGYRVMRDLKRCE
jgi:hypothetical protein